MTRNVLWYQFKIKTKHSSGTIFYFKTEKKDVIIRKIQQVNTKTKKQLDEKELLQTDDTQS